MRDVSETNRAIDLYADTVKKICFLYLKNKEDTEDIFQNVFLKYMSHAADFETEEHEKAWFVRVTLNCCKDLLKSFHRKNIALEDILETAVLPEEYTGVMQAVFELEEKYRTAVYLHYYEGYTAAEIAKLLHKNINTVYTLLARAKVRLKEKLTGDRYEG